MAKVKFTNMAKNIRERFGITDTDEATNKKIEDAIKATNDMSKKYGRSVTAKDIAMAQAKVLFDGDVKAGLDRLSSQERGRIEASANSSWRAGSPSLDENVIGSRKSMGSSGG